MGDATEDLAIDRWLDGECGWLGLVERLDLRPAEASAMRRAARRAAQEALVTIRLRRRAEGGEALAVELLAERHRLEVDPTGLDDRIVERLRAMQALPPEDDT